jgi:RNA-splicing ligase RtcB
LSVANTGDSTNSTILTLPAGAGKKAKRGPESGQKTGTCQTQQNWRKMKRKRTKRKQQRCEVAKVIDTVEQAVSTAKKVYRVIEPVVNAITNRPKTK